MPPTRPSGRKTNPIYVGDIAHRGKVHSGNHPPIIDREIWDAVQAQLTDNVKGGRSRREANSSMLGGLLFDEAGEPLIPVHSRKGERRYRYYVSRSAHHRRGESARPAIRMPAIDIEKVVCDELAKLLSPPIDLLAQCGIDVAPSQLSEIISKSEGLAQRAAKRETTLIRNIVERVTVNRESLDIAICSRQVAELLQVHSEAGSNDTFVHNIVARLSRTGRALRLVNCSGAAATEDDADATLVRLVVRARGWWRELEQSGQTVSDLASREGVTASYLTRVLRLAFLAPDAISALVAGSLRAGVDASQLFSAGAISADWSEQRRALLPLGSR